VNAGNNVSLNAAGALSAASVSAGNAASLAGSSVTVSGAAQASAGALNVTTTSGGASIGGNASAGTDVIVNTSGSANFGGNVTAGDTFSLNAGGSANFLGNVNAGDDINLAANNFAFRGNVLAGNDVTIDANGGAVVFNGSAAQTVRADNGAVLIDGAVTKTGSGGGGGGGAGLLPPGDLLLDAGTTLTVTGAINVAGSLDTISGGTSTFGGNVVAGNNVTLDANGNAINFNGAAGQTVRADNGALLIDGAVSKTGGDLTLDAGTTLEVTGALQSSGAISSTSAGTSTFGGAVTAGDDLSIAASSIRLFGNLTGGSDVGDTITLNGPIVLNAADSRWSAHGIRVNGSINGAAPGAQTLRLAAGDRSILNGGIGNTARLGEFRIEDGFTQLGSVSGGLFVVNADRFVLAPASRPSNVGVDLASSGNLVFNTTQFTMAQGTKATVLGNFTINNGAGTARLSDVNTTGVFEVNAGQIVLVARPAGSSFTSIGGTLDTGLDFVSLGGFRFSVAPILDGAGLVRFASPNAAGDLNGNLIDFVMLNLNDADLGVSSLTGGFGIVGADFFDGANFFDLIADGTANTSSATTIAALAPQETRGAREAGGVALSVSERRQLEALLGGAIEIRMPDVSEILEIGTGSVAFRDQGRAEVAALASSAASETVAANSRSTEWRRPLPSVVQRFSGARVRDLLATSEALRKVSRESASAFSAAAGSLASAYAAQEPLAAVVDRARSAGNAAELDALRVIGRWVKLGEELGLSTAERLRAGDPASKTLWPQTTVALEGGIEFKVPASAFDAEFWMALDRPVASK
jgi:hypothetical protein